MPTSHGTRIWSAPQAIKYASVVLEKVIFGSLMMGHEELEHD
jgi:hypothetical protein